MGSLVIISGDPPFVVCTCYVRTRRITRSTTASDAVSSLAKLLLLLSCQTWLLQERFNELHVDSVIFTGLMQDVAELVHHISFIESHAFGRRLFT